jgi:hypothetical protein
MFRTLKTAATSGLCAVALLCTSCSTVLPIIGAVTTITGGGGLQCKLSLSVAKKYYVEEAAYQGILLTLNSMADSGVIKKGTPISITAKSILDKRLIPAHHAVGSAVDACNASQLETQIQATTDAIADLQMLVARAKAGATS